MVEKNLELEKVIFNRLIQSTVDIYTYSKNGETNVLKSGKLLNFNIKLPFIYFVMEYKNKSREYPLPQPFNFKWQDDQLMLSYQLDDICSDNKIVDRLVKLGQDSESKIFDKRVFIKPI